MSQDALLWCFYGPVLLAVLSIPATTAVMRGAIALRVKRTRSRGPLREEEAAHRYAQFRALKPYRTAGIMTSGQRMFGGAGLVLSLFLIVGGFVARNMPSRPGGGSVSDAAEIPMPNFDSVDLHLVGGILLLTGGGLAIVAMWTLVFGRIVNLYRADWYRAGLTTAERAEQKSMRKSRARIASQS